MQIRRIVALAGVLFIVIPIIVIAVEELILIQQYRSGEITSNELQDRVIRIIIDLITPTEVTIVEIFGVYGPLVVGIVLWIYWWWMKTTEDYSR